jgi:hypothetical protein
MIEQFATETHRDTKLLGKQQWKGTKQTVPAYEVLLAARLRSRNVGGHFL